MNIGSVISQEFKYQPAQCMYSVEDLRTANSVRSSQNIFSDKTTMMLTFWPKRNQWLRNFKQMVVACILYRSLAPFVPGQVCRF